MAPSTSSRRFTSLIISVDLIQRVDEQFDELVEFLVLLLVRSSGCIRTIAVLEKRDGRRVAVGGCRLSLTR